MAHENLHRDEDIAGSSDRSFGLVFAVVFLIIALWPVFSGGGLRWWALMVGAAFCGIALTKPGLLAYPNRQWMRLGLLLGRIVSPIALGVLYFGVVTPIAVVMKVAGKDPLRLGRDVKSTTYWIKREPPGPPPDSLSNQF